MNTIRYYANPTGSALDAMRSGHIGMIDTPAQGNTLPYDVDWVADNGCFGNGYPGDDGYITWLHRRADRVVRCAFAVAADVVGDAAATLARSAPMLPRIRAAGYPAALVAQNGLEHLDVPWGSFDALFLGGSPECRRCRYIRPIADRRREDCPTCRRQLVEWKLSPAARALTAEALRRGKWVHMGRVNSARRLAYAHYIGCHSADGTYLVFGPNINLPKLLGWVRGINSQGLLWEVPA